MHDSAEKGFTERRQVERKYLVFYPRVFDNETFQVFGHVVNLSHRGIMLLSHTVKPVNEKYRLRMRLPNEMCDHCELLINVTSRWCKKDINPDFHLSGFLLHRLSAAAKLDITGLLDEFSFASSEA